VATLSASDQRQCLTESTVMDLISEQLAAAASNED
jgi:hypothetical protein